MDYVDSVVKTVESLQNEFKEVSKTADRDAYDKFGWKCIDFVSGIKTSTPYTKEQRFALKSALLNLKSLALRLGMYKQYLEEYQEEKDKDTNKVVDLEDKKRQRVAPVAENAA